MARKELYQHFGIQVDLAVEAHEIVRGETGQEIPGVVMDEEKFEHASVKLVRIEDERAVQVMGKPVGNYITIEAPAIRQNNREIHHQITSVLARKLQGLIRINPDASILVVGLGNWHATPDALGPRVVDYVMVTRHLHEYAPEELQGGLRPVSALAPGVLGITGIETAEIIKGVVERIKPAMIIAIDALASRSVERISTTIQIADTGINPGSGVGNKRAGINQETMGVPVIAIGVPTVCHAAVIAEDTIENMFRELSFNPSLSQLYQGLNSTVLQKVIENVLRPFAGNLMVTPKEIDELILNTSKIIAAAINQALHPGIEEGASESYLN